MYWQKDFQYSPAETNAYHETDVCHTPSSFSRWHTRNDKMSEGADEEQESPDEEEHRSATFSDSVGGFGIPIPTDRIVPAEVDNTGHQRVPEDFDQNIAEYKS